MPAAKTALVIGGSDVSVGIGAIVALARTQATLAVHCAPTKVELAERFADLRAVEVIDGAGHLFVGKIQELAAAVATVAQTLLLTPPPLRVA